VLPKNGRKQGAAVITQTGRIVECAFCIVANNHLLKELLKSGAKEAQLSGRFQLI
jgi:hypothetical protein